MIGQAIDTIMYKIKSIKYVLHYRESLIIFYDLWVKAINTVNFYGFFYNSLLSFLEVLIFY